mmetsp:Transcript_25973/g.60302  ORF Transcript_25973/g.60302 Transcript_25973/m.60302 type:complete len:406 (-) Transcript_25973:4228-5445(-)
MFEREIFLEKLNNFRNQKPEIVFQWQDNYSNAAGYLAIDALKNGAAGGGTRVHSHVTLDEVSSLAKVMRLKFILSKTNIGGAKSGLRIDPQDENILDILARWFKTIKPLLLEYYGTGSDLNTDIQEITQVLNKLGIQNAQQGIIHGLYRNKSERIRIANANMTILQRSKLSVGHVDFYLSELVTGYSVATSLLKYYALVEEDISGKKVYVQGAGNVGAAAAYYIHEAGGKIVAINDMHHGIISHAGLDRETLVKIMEQRSIQGASDTCMKNTLFNSQLLQEPIDIFIPAAKSKVVSRAMIDNLIACGLEVIVSGANLPFVEKEALYGALSQYVDSKIVLIPDFLANMGMASYFHTLISSYTTAITNEHILATIKETIYEQLEIAFRYNNGKLMTAALYDIALSEN